MDLAGAQRDVRAVYAGGFFGQLVSGALWLFAAGLGTWVSPTAAIVALLLGGTLIFPLTTLSLWVARRPVALPRGHPMAALATQVAFTVPPGLLVALAATGYRQDWFFPAAMMIVGAHYLPFVFLYGMRLYSVLATVMIAGGLALPLWAPNAFSTGGWVTGGLLVAFAFALGTAARATDR
ncbi:MAG: hypothetical protein WBB15_01505 [Ornithinimicrobium sp.]